MTSGMTGLLCCGHEASRSAFIHGTPEEDERHVEQSQVA